MPFGIGIGRSSPSSGRCVWRETSDRTSRCRPGGARACSRARGGRRGRCRRRGGGSAPRRRRRTDPRGSPSPAETALLRSLARAGTPVVALRAGGGAVPYVLPGDVLDLGPEVPVADSPRQSRVRLPTPRRDSPPGSRSSASRRAAADRADVVGECGARCLGPDGGPATAAPLPGAEQDAPPAGSQPRRHAAAVTRAQSRSPPGRRSPPRWASGSAPHARAPAARAGPRRPGRRRLRGHVALGDARLRVP